MKPFLIFIGLLAALIGFLIWRFPYVLDNSESIMHLVYWAMLALLVGSGLVASNQLHWRKNVQYAIWWITLAIVLVAGYSYREELVGSRLVSELIPSRPQIQADGTMILRADEFHQFNIEGRVNGQPVRFLVDTGAADIVLSQADARRAGFNVDELEYTRLYSTANGYTTGAPVRLKRLQVGGMVVDDIEASVNRGEMDGSLLGVSFLRLLSSYQVKGNTLTLVP